MGREVTQRELARILNVSISTISKSLSGDEEISTETRKRVLEMAKDMHYKPNYYASQLRKGSPKAIGVILPNVLNPFYAKLLAGIESVLSKKGYKMIILFSNDLKRKEAKCISHFLDGSVDGIIICIARETQATRRMEHLLHPSIDGIPKIFVDRFDESIDDDQVVSNDFESTKKVCEDLIQNLGCKEIIFVSIMGGLTIEKLRGQGYRSVMAKNNLTTSISELYATDSIQLQKDLASLFKSKKIDAVICANSTSTSIVLNVIRSCFKENLPKIQVVGYCDINIKNHTSYPYFSLIDQRSDKIGGKAAERLLDRLRGSQVLKPKVQRLKSRIVK